MENKNNFFYQLLLFLFFIFLFFSHVPGLLIETVKQERYGMDFQWSGAKLLWEGINHYQYFLNGEIEGRIIFNQEGQYQDLDKKIIFFQAGEYLQGLYVILYPFAKMDWVYAKTLWAFINFILSMIIPYLLCKKFELSKEKTLLVIFCSVIMPTTTMAMSLGQQTPFIFLFFILPFVWKSKLSYILSGISYFKYSIGYALFLFYLSQKKIKIILLSSIPAILGWLIYCAITDSNYLDNLMEPLKVATAIGWTTTKNPIIYLLSFINSINIFGDNTLWVLILSVIINFFFIIKITRIKNELLKLSCLCISVLIFAPHNAYGYIMLLPIFIYSLKNSEEFLSKLNIVIFIYLNMSYPFILQYLSILNRHTDLEILNNFYYYLSYFNILLLLIILIMNIRKISHKE